jgi:hypothetical protein
MRSAFEQPNAFDSGSQEPNMHADMVRHSLLSSMPATQRDRKVALVVAVSALLFVIAVPYAGTPLAPIPAFVASYQSAMALSDFITAVLLLSQFAMLRSWALLLLACGYLFTTAAAIVHGLTFPACLRRPACWVPARRAPHGYR